MNELETKLNQIADSLLVQSRLVDRFERPLYDGHRWRTEERFANHEDRLDRIEAALEKATGAHVRLIESLQDLAARQAQTDAALQGLTAQIDRFLRGQQRNRHD